MAGRPSPSVLAAILAASAFSVPLISNWEGKSNDPYRDIAGIQTVCYGNTNVPMKRYSNEECTQLLKKSNDEFARGVLELSPELVDKPKILAATTSLAYNIGIRNYSRSTTRRQYRAGNYGNGCDALRLWNKLKVKENGRLVIKVSQGLVNRRNAEYKLCMEGVDDYSNR